VEAVDCGVELLADERKQARWSGRTVDRASADAWSSSLSGVCGAAADIAATTGERSGVRTAFQPN
jgi:hypothetical protein